MDLGGEFVLWVPTCSIKIIKPLEPMHASKMVPSGNLRLVMRNNFDQLTNVSCAIIINLDDGAVGV